VRVLKGLGAGYSYGDARFGTVLNGAADVKCQRPSIHSGRNVREYTENRVTYMSCLKHGRENIGQSIEEKRQYWFK